MEYLYQYGLFLAQTLTLVAAFIVVVAVIAANAGRHKVKKGEIELDDIGEDLLADKEAFAEQGLSKAERKALAKSKKQQQKQQDETGTSLPKLFVLEFNGSTDAHEVEQLRKEVSFVLLVAKPEDQVLLKLESPGGVVHGYGLAASQLARLRQANIELTAVVDKVAASGGYMMACVANRIVAAPFAVLGSVGVVAELPNFHRLLQRNHVDYDTYTAGEFKRTVTILGENTEKGKAKFQEELNEVHLLFKTHVNQYRPQLDIDAIATGEVWHGQQALDNQLVDALGTSDDLILAELEKRQIITVKFMEKQSLADKFAKGMAKVSDTLVRGWLTKLQQQRFQ